jgi:tRNA modification GTPase
MAGELSARLHRPMETLADSLALVEAGIDFSEEDISFLGGDELRGRIDEIDDVLSDLVKSSARFEPLTHEPTFVLVGRPNAGKSTLLNALAGRDRAIVSPVAGTTRDVLSAEVRLQRGLVRMIDVAGLDESHDADDAIEKGMDVHARRAIEAADFVILVCDTTDSRPRLQVGRDADITVMSKSDLASGDAAVQGGVSAMTGQGLAELRAELDALAFGRAASGQSLALNARHLAAIAEARASLARAREIAATAAGPELIALELRDALDALGRVLGQVTPDDVLGRVFATFCIGK